MANSRALTPTLEDYLEAIARLLAEKGAARVRDVAKALAVDKSSVTAALNSLSDKGFINYRPYRSPTLTSRGKKAAADIIGRHEVIRRFLSQILLVSEDVADANACRMEHVLDREVLERLSLFAEFVKECPRAGEDWLQMFGRYFEHGGVPQEDQAAMKRWLGDFQGRLRKRRSEGEERTMISLDELKPGGKGKIVRVGGAGAVRRRIVEMGVVRGTPIEVIKVAPLGDPIEVKVKGYNLSLRKEEAAAITVEPE